MSGLIHFSSGKTLEITEVEFNNMPIKLNSKGIKTQKTQSGALIPLNSMTMEFIEYIPEVSDREISDIPKLRVRDGLDGGDPIDMKEERMEQLLPKQDFAVEKKKPKTQEEVMAEMMAKSNCKHEPDKMVLYRQHTAKGIRYFPKCSFCGKRERYVSESKIIKGEYKGTPNERWTETDIIDAIDWIDN